MWKSACLGKARYQELCSLCGLCLEAAWTHGVVSGPMLAKDFSCRASMKGIFDRSTEVRKHNETTKWDLLQLLVFQQNQDTLSGCFWWFFQHLKDSSILVLISAFYSSICLRFRGAIDFFVLCLKSITQCIGVQGLVSSTRSLNLGSSTGQRRYRNLKGKVCAVLHSLLHWSISDQRDDQFTLDSWSALTGGCALDTTHGLTVTNSIMMEHELHWGTKPELFRGLMQIMVLLTLASRYF